MFDVVKVKKEYHDKLSNGYSMTNQRKMLKDDQMKNQVKKEYLVKLIEGCGCKEVGAQPALGLGCRNLLGEDSFHDQIM